MARLFAEHGRVGGSEAGLVCASDCRAGNGTQPALGPRAMNISERFLPPPWTAAVVLLCASACINVPAVEPAQAEVRITAPAGTAYTNGVVEVRLDVTGHTPDRVELLKDGEVMAELAPPYTYTWDTAGEAEGTYRLEARAALGDLAYVSASREVVVDRTPPRVVSRVPEQGAQEVWVQSPIRAEFSEPVKRSTVTTESVHLTVGDVAMAHTVSLSEDGKTVTVVPVTAMTAPSTVALAFSGTVTDLAGNAAVNLGEAWSWAVPEFVPYPPLVPDPAAPSSPIVPLIRLDASGSPTILTHQFHSGNSHLLVTRWTGSGWEQLGGGLKTSSPDYNINSLDIQLLPDGTPIVAWQEDLGAEFNNYIHVAKWTGTTWERLGDEQGILPGRPHAWNVSLQLNTQGHPVVAINMDPEDVDGAAIHVQQWTGESWQQIGHALQGDPQFRKRAPALALDSHDNPVVAFSQESDSTGRILVSRWTGTSWEQLGHTANTSSEIKSVSRISLSLTPTNQPIVSWHGRNPTTTQENIHHSEWHSNQWSSLGTPERQYPESNSSISDTRSTPDGRLITLSTEASKTDFSINLNYHSGTSWTRIWSTQDIPDAAKRRGSSPSMATDASGNIATAWCTAGDDQKRAVVVYRRNR